MVIGVVIIGLFLFPSKTEAFSLKTIFQNIFGIQKSLPASSIDSTVKVETTTTTEETKSSDSTTLYKDVPATTTSLTKDPTTTENPIALPPVVQPDTQIKIQPTESVSGVVKTTPRPIVYGMKNNFEVRTLQKKLKELGYFSGRVDGSYGKITAAAVKLFKEVNKIQGEGKTVDGNTLSLLTSSKIGLPVISLNCTITSFSASPSIISEGGSTTLKWSTSGCISTDMTGVTSTGEAWDGGITNNVNGSEVYGPPVWNFVYGNTGVYTFTLIAAGINGIQVKKTIYVNITKLGTLLCNIKSFSANPSPTPNNTTTTLSWSTSGCAEVSITGVDSNGQAIPGWNNLPVVGSQITGPLSQGNTGIYTFTLHAFSKNKVIRKKQDITVPISSSCEYPNVVQTMATNPQLRNWANFNLSQNPAEIEIGQVTITSNCGEANLNQSEVSVTMYPLGPTAFSSIKIYDGSNLIGTGPVNNIVTFNPPYIINTGQSKTLTYRGVLNNSAQGPGTLGVAIWSGVNSSIPGDSPYTVWDASFTIFP